MTTKYTPEELKELMQAKAKEIGIDKIGFTSADPFDQLREWLRLQQERQYQSGFEEKDIEKRVVPKKTMPKAKSIIAIAIAYPSRLHNAPVSKPGSYRGIFARASWGEDYHHVLRRKLQKLGEYLQEIVPDAVVESMVDTGVLSDRAVAERAGIGWSGKNTSLITEEFGSWVYLGEMITDVYLPPDEPIADQCGDCTICIDACPTNAIVEPGVLNAKSCIAYLTQTKDMLPDEYRTKIGNRLYGCDTCQVVCPKNRKRDFSHHVELTPDPEKVKPLLKPLLNMSNREFKEQYGEMAGSWRGKKPIQRNAILALGHFRDQTAIPELRTCLVEDPRPVIRGTAAYALGRIGTTKAREILETQLELEKESIVLEEIQKALAEEGWGHR
ncbi:tRNA epoxyqueuosine(34) reductase QueG [Risungbinella massiliensis]|uniref:tRNA epoxyqueuosine(34) reductase QueG n=1 Tax=Risungbinella massiliensis TaxID=1329796 RepID=UPI0005CC685C|nr:tRNA epoxyqueuosine(34) reductase QueG [Risungbinella massiliensis]